MRYFFTALALISSTPTYAETETSGSLGGALFNTDSFTLTGNFRHKIDTGPREYTVESDLVYKEDNGNTSREQLNFFAKFNQDISDKHYIQLATRYRHDTRSRTVDQLVYSVGHGYRIVRNDKTRISNEASLGYKHGFSGLSEVVLRDSIWLSHKISTKVLFSNQFFIEQGKTTFISNKAELKFNVTENVTFSIQDLYTKDSRSDNTLSFNIGLKL